MSRPQRRTALEAGVSNIDIAADTLRPGEIRRRTSHRTYDRGPETSGVSRERRIPTSGLALSGPAVGRATRRLQAFTKIFCKHMAVPTAGYATFTTARSITVDTRASGGL